VLRPLSDRGIKLVAEGLETQNQCDLALDMGCHYGQGWFLGKPQPYLANHSLLQGNRISAEMNLS